MALQYKRKSSTFIVCYFRSPLRTCTQICSLLMTVTISLGSRCQRRRKDAIISRWVWQLCRTKGERLLTMLVELCRTKGERLVLLEQLVVFLCVFFRLFFAYHWNMKYCVVNHFLIVVNYFTFVDLHFSFGFKSFSLGI